MNSFLLTSKDCGSSNLSLSGAKSSETNNQISGHYLKKTSIDFSESNNCTSKTN